MASLCRTARVVVRTGVNKERTIVWMKDNFNDAAWGG